MKVTRTPLVVLGVPAHHQHVLAADVLGVGGVGRGRDALRPPAGVGAVLAVQGEAPVDGAPQPPATEQEGPPRLTVEVCQDGVDADPASEQRGQGLDLPDVLVGAAQVYPDDWPLGHARQPTVMSAASQVVVGAAIVRDGRVLACRRTAPAGGRGQVGAPGRQGRARRDSGRCAGAGGTRGARDRHRGVALAGRGGRRSATALVLRAAAAALVARRAGAGRARRRPLAAADELDAVDWLDPDRPFLEEIASSAVSARRTLLAPPTDSRWLRCELRASKPRPSEYGLRSNP